MGAGALKAVGLEAEPRRRAIGLAGLVAIYAIVAHVLPRPEAVTPAGWRVTGIFFATIAGLMLRPAPGPVIVLLGLMLVVLVGQVSLGDALAGYSASSVWLVLAAMLMSRVLRETGLARRLALGFVRRFGQSSLGVAYSLVMADATLATGIPSITARSGGIILPITRGISELYDSHPGTSANRLGRFLMLALYQSSVVVCAMFLTGQASNVLAATLAADLAGVEVTWTSWFLAGIAPGILSCLVVPWVVYRLDPPGVRRTPDAAAHAGKELARLGPLTRNERITLATFIVTVLLWATSQWHRALFGFSLDVAVVAVLGLAVLVLANVASWSDLVRQAPAWEVFVWYGGLLTMGELLQRTGSTEALAGWVGAGFGGWPWLAVLLVTVVVYFYAHYGFASITTHIVAMFPPFLVMLIGAGAPPLLAVYALACLANLTAGLTHYGTTTAPIVFAEGYASHRAWWRVGLVASVVNLAVWVGAGFAWWKLLGFW